jgi:hypothetical protein
MASPGGVLDAALAEDRSEEEVLDPVGDEAEDSPPDAALGHKTISFFGA